MYLCFPGSHRDTSLRFPCKMLLFCPTEPVCWCFAPPWGGDAASSPPGGRSPSFRSPRHLQTRAGDREQNPCRGAAVWPSALPSPRVTGPVACPRE